MPNYKKVNVVQRCITGPGRVEIPTAAHKKRQVHDSEPAFFLQLMS